MVMSSLTDWLLLRCVITSLDTPSQNLNDSLALGKYSRYLHAGVYKYKRVFKCFEAQLLKIQHCQPQTAASPGLAGRELTWYIPSVKHP